MINPPRADLNDINPQGWVDRRLPATWRPFAKLARLDRPVGIWLSLFPTWAALLIASNGRPGVLQPAVFSLGAVLMRSAGSTINDMADRNIDGAVERTRFRPLASRQLNLSQAAVFLCFQLALASALLWFLDPMTQVLALCVLPLVIIYPFCKRFTYWPQAILGACFNWGMLMAWSQYVGNVPAAGTVFWAGAVAWQIGYDTIYAYVDIEHDKRIGLRSTAILFGSHGKVCVSMLYCTAVICWAATGWVLDFSLLYWIGLGAVAAHFSWQIWSLDLRSPEINFRVFRGNMSTGFLLCLSALLGLHWLG